MCAGVCVCMCERTPGWGIVSPLGWMGEWARVGRSVGAFWIYRVPNSYACYYDFHEVDFSSTI